MKQEYVAGFLFANNFELVALIEKQKPAWQKGKLNAIGGKIEPGETPLQAMVREFQEETSMLVENWRQFVTLSGDGFVVHFFFAMVSEDAIYEVKTMTEEEVSVYEYDELCDLKTIPNLRWLIPMAMSMQYETAAAFNVTELKR
jgi:8-oxo-dGTP diphosphatase